MGQYAGVAHLSTSWFRLAGASGFAELISGVLLAIFLYSGWDAAATVGEESHGQPAGKAAGLSVAILFGSHAGTVRAFQGIVPNPVTQNSAANILAFVGQTIGAGVWNQVMTFAMLGRSLAPLQAAIVSSSRIGCALGGGRVLPPALGRVHPVQCTPMLATVTFGLTNVLGSGYRRYSRRSAIHSYLSCRPWA